MKLILTAFVTLMSVIGLAEVPRPGAKPGPVGGIGADALNVSVYGAPATKIADLKAGSSLIVMASGGNSSSSFGDATSANVKKAGEFSLENKQMSVTKTVFIGRGGARNSYQVSPFTKRR